MSRMLISVVGLAAAVGIAGWMLSGRGSDVMQMPNLRFAHRAPTEESFIVPPLTEEYRNEALRFSLLLPEGFTAGELPVDDEGGRTIILQNERGEGIQIYSRPFDNIRNLTADMVRADIPDMRISDIQKLEVGENHSGIAFLSDNEAFGGSSREVWFVFRGNLYQISTYARLDALLQTMFETWKFF